LVKRIISESRLLNEQNEQIAIPQGATMACYYGDHIAFMDNNGDPVGEDITLNGPSKSEVCGKVKKYMDSIMITNKTGMYKVRLDGRLVKIATGEV
jgi:hypothetical protein